MGTHHAGPPVRIIHCTNSMQIRVEAAPGSSPGQPGWLDISHYRRSPESLDPGDFSRVGGGARIRADHVEELFDALERVVEEATARWPRWRGGSHA